jgi:TolB-like protein
MSSAGLPPPLPRPSVFISYASDDRAAARKLRDTLASAGLEVWYDENELGGGDAWDQKIRKQIRDCDYFMPVISAVTERRKEGYFRREWRLACERTLDMADDVLFLLPVSIDETSEHGARVPDRFLTVQWLRAPNGDSTAALQTLIKRLLAGEHHAPPRPPLMGRSGRDGGDHHPPRMPPFPPAPEKNGIGNGLRFLAEVFWWCLTVVWMLFAKMPRWARAVLMIWFVFTIMGISNCRFGSAAKKKESEVSSDEIRAAVEEALKAAGKAADAKAGDATPKTEHLPDYARVGADMARRFGKGQIDLKAAGKPLVLVPFTAPSSDAASAQFARAVFRSCYAELLVARSRDIGIAEPNATATATAAPPAVPDEDPLVTVGRNLGATFILGAKLSPINDVPHLVVKLIKIADGATVWTDSYRVSAHDSAITGTKISEAVLAHVPAAKRRPTAPPTPPVP